MASLVYRTDTGAAVSVGTVLADPLPDDLTAAELNEADYDGLRGGWRTWDPATRTVIATPGWLDPAIAETNDRTLREQAETALAANRNIISGASTVIAKAKPGTAAAQASQAWDHTIDLARAVRALADTQNKIIRLIIGRLEGTD